MKKMLALILTAILTASAFAIPASAVEITDPDVLAECKTYAEEVKAYIADRGRNDNLSKLYFSYRDYQDPISQPVQYDIPTTWRTVAEYKVGKQTRYYIVARDDEEGLCNVWSGSDVSGNPNEDAGKILDYYATLVYDYETGEVSTVESDLTPNDVEARKTLIEETILPYFTANSDKAPIRVYALQTDEDTVQCLVAYQSNNETYCRRVQYDIETEKVSMPASNVISANSYDPILVNSNTVVYDCAFKTAKINTFTGTYVFDSETEVSESNPEPAPAPTAPSTSVITPEPVKDGWEKSGTSWLYYDNGQQVKNDWVKDQSKWYYMDPDGVMVTGWQTIAGKKYYLSDSGVMQTGWKQIDGSWYYFKGSGEIATGWLQITSGSPWYYLKSDGKMVTGWMQIDGKWYCFKSNGEMYANTTTPDGYQVGSDGAMIEDSSEEGTSGNEDSVIFDEDYLDFSHGDTTYFFGAYYPEDVATATTLVAAMARHYADNPFTFSVNYALCYECSADEYLVAISTNSKTSKDNPNLAMLCAIYNKKENHVMFTDEWTDLDYLRADIALNEFNRWYFSENTLTRALNALGWF